MRRPIRVTTLLRLTSIMALAAAAAGCTAKDNPDVCCVGAADCARLGVEEPRPCGAGRACRDFTCVAAECTTSADCTAPGAPLCADGLCVAACLSDADCPSSAPYCDAEDRACRGCEADAECASGVCLEADGACVASPAEVIYVSSLGADSGECDASAPCASLSYALQKVTPTRQVIHIVGGGLNIGATVLISQSVVIDGTGTRLMGPTMAPVFTLGAGVVVIEGISLPGPNGTPAVTVDAGSTLRLFDVRLDQTVIRVTSGALDLRKGTLRSSSVDCTSGTVTIRENRFETGGVQASNCQTTIERSRFEPSLDMTILTTGGLLTVQNNVFVVASEFTDLAVVGGHAPGSTISFNTIVNTSTVTQSPAAITCDPTVVLTSNIFAYNSNDPINGCAVRSSLFDLPGAPDAGGNLSADAATFFRDRAGGDFHLAPSSPALDQGEPGIVTTDLDGHLRHQRPDVGAYEAP